MINLADSGSPADEWLRNAAARIPGARQVLDESKRVLHGERDVIAYAGWGSNDKNRHRRFLGFEWLPGAIATEFVSTNGGRFTSRRPAGTSARGTTARPSSPVPLKRSPPITSARAPPGPPGHVAEPFLQFTPRPDYVLPAYFSGRNLADSLSCARHTRDDENTRSIGVFFIWPGANGGRRILV